MKKISQSGERTPASKPVTKKTGKLTYFPAAPEANGFALKEAAVRYRVSQEALTRLTGFSLRAVANWTKGTTPSPSTRRRLTELNRLFTAMEKLVSPEAIGPWLTEPNPAFDGSTPLQVLERGEADRLWRMIFELQSGQPG